MKRVAFSACLIVLVSVATGCRNRCNNCLGWGQPRIGVPATYSYRPNQAQPYYSQGNTANPGTSVANPNLGNPSLTPGATPAIPASGRARVPVQPASAPSGWRPSPSIGNGQGNLSTPATNGTSTTSFYTNQPGLVIGAPNYSSTTVDETRDPTRMPPSDATAVRAPANFNPHGNWAMINPAVNPPRSINVPGSYEYHTQPQLTRNYANQYQTAPVINPGGFYSTPNQPVVLAQSTTRQDSRSNPNFQAGWRNRVPDYSNVNR